MPIWLRGFHISKINEHHKKQNDEIEKAKRKGNQSSKGIQTPNINPSSTYNFKK